jgi:glycosyltransferase involved in cell wall biosynthesis
VVQPRASIIIPAHNRPELLAEAVASCLAQTLGGVEVVVVDDGSDSDLRAGLRNACDAACGGGKVRLVRQARRGANIARNRGVAEATGQFIQFLDSDDLLHPEKLEKQTPLLQTDPHLDMALCLEEWFQHEIGDMGLLWNKPNAQPELDRFAWNDGVFNVASPLWRRSALEKIGPWDARLTCWQDWEFHVRALAKGIRYAHLPQVLVFVRDHPGPRISTTVPELDRERSKFEAFRLAGQYLKAHRQLSRYRGDGLALYLLGIAHALVRLRAITLARTALWTAARYAGSPGIKTAGLVMLAASVAAQARGQSQVSALNRAQLLVEGFVRLPVRESYWQSIPTVRTEEPTALLQAIARVREQAGDRSAFIGRNNHSASRT